MPARRHLLRQPLLWAFAGGCVSGAVLIGLWRGGADAPPLLEKQGTLIRSNEAAAPPAATTSAAPSRAIPHDASAAVRLEPTSPKGTEDTDGGSPTEAGSSVADILMRLEDAYRQKLAAADPVDTASASRELTPTAPGSLKPTAEQSHTPPRADTAGTAAPAREGAAVALGNAAAPPKNAPAGGAQPTAAPEAGAQPVLASQEEARRRDVYVNNVYQNANVTNVQQDVYLAQQLAVLQYMQLLALSPYAQVASPAYGQRGATARRAPAFTSTLTNPDNPWGFAFPPTALVK